MKPQRILLIRLSSLGDCVLVSGLIEQIHQSHREAKIVLAIKKQFAGLYEDDPRVELLLCDDGGKHRGLIGIWRYAREIRVWKPDLIVDLHGTLRASMLRLMLPLHSWRRVRKNGWQRRRQLQTRRFPKSIHVTARFHAAWRGKTPREAHPLPPRLVTASAFLQSRSGVALVPGAAWPTKQWPVASFVQLARQLLEDDFPVTVLGGAAESMLADHFAALATRYPDLLSIQLANQPLQRLRDQLAGFRLVVANDTGLMHMADAVGTPVIALFGPTAPVLGFAPQGTHATTVHGGIECSPCTLHGQKQCPLGHHACMTGIAVEHIQQIVNRTLEETPL